MSSEAPRDGICPGCRKIICYLFSNDLVWEHSNPTVIHSPDGTLVDKDGKKFYVSYPLCSGSGKPAENPYTPTNYDLAWKSKPHPFLRMILDPEQANLLRRKNKIDYY